MTPPGGRTTGASSPPANSDGGDAVSETAAVGRGLPATPRREHAQPTDRRGGPGRAQRGDTHIQRGRPDPAHNWTPRRARAGQPRTTRRQPRYERACELRPGPYQRSRTPCGPGDTTSTVMDDRSHESCRNRRPAPLLEGPAEGNGSHGRASLCEAGLPSRWRRAGSHAWAGPPARSLTRGTRAASSSSSTALVASDCIGTARVTNRPPLA
jgi:hypothetical protein